MFGICLVASGRGNAIPTIIGLATGTQDSIRRPSRPPRFLRDGRPAPVEVQWKSHPDATRILLARHLHTTGMFFNSAIFSPKNAVLGAENAAPESGIMLDTQEVTGSSPVSPNHVTYAASKTYELSCSPSLARNSRNPAFGVSLVSSIREAGAPALCFLETLSGRKRTRRVKGWRRHAPPRIDVYQERKAFW